MSHEQLHAIRTERNLLIPLSDGAQLAADLYLPDEPGQYPALVSFYPYHKDDLIAAIFEYPRRYFAERGYACLLVDFRGLGNSSGTVWDAMDQREATDGAEMVEWAAQQPWCDGNVGMWGMSYGGITSFKTAAQQPSHLKAIAPIMGSLDIYHDFIYPGGCLNCLGGFLHDCDEPNAADASRLRGPLVSALERTFGKLRAAVCIPVARSPYL